MPAKSTRGEWSATGPLGDNDVVIVSGGEFSLHSGTPVVAVTVGHVGWLLDPTADEGITAIARVPAEWKTYAVEALWIAAGAGAGNVCLRLDAKEVAITGALTAPSAGTVVTAAAPAQSVLSQTVLAAAIAAPTTSGVAVYTVVRDADNGADTLAVDIALLGLRLTRVS